MALICFFAGARDIVPESNTRVERKSEDVAAIRRESDCCHGEIIFVNESPEALTSCRVPDSADN